MYHNPPNGRFIAILALLAASLVGEVAITDVAAEQRAARTVMLIVDYGDGVQKRFTRLAWREDMTVLKAMNAAAKHPRGIQFEYRGAGPTALLTKIDDLENQGGRRKNWLYQVDGKPGQRSFGIQKLKAGDTVLWEFGKYRYNRET